MGVGNSCGRDGSVMPATNTNAHLISYLTFFLEGLLKVPSQSLFLQLNRVALGQTVNYKQASQGNPVAQNITASHGSHTTHSIRQDQEDTRRLLSIPSVVVGAAPVSG